MRDKDISIILYEMAIMVKTLCTSGWRGMIKMLCLLFFSVKWLMEKSNTLV